MPEIIMSLIDSLDFDILKFRPVLIRNAKECKSMGMEIRIFEFFIFFSWATSIPGNMEVLRPVATVLHEEEAKIILFRIAKMATSELIRLDL